MTDENNAASQASGRDAALLALSMHTQNLFVTKIAREQFGKAFGRSSVRR
jgi:hypothetical protein